MLVAPTFYVTTMYRRRMYVVYDAKRQYYCIRTSVYIMRDKEANPRIAFPSLPIQDVIFRVTHLA